MPIPPQAVSALPALASGLGGAFGKKSDSGVLRSGDIVTGNVTLPSKRESPFTTPLIVFGAIAVVALLIRK